MLVVNGNWITTCWFCTDDEIVVDMAASISKRLGAAVGRPRVAPSTPVIFDVQLLYVPGVSDFDK
jgi:hypothetical protein